jgi:hypothetical protein
MKKLKRFTQLLIATSTLGSIGMASAVVMQSNTSTVLPGTIFTYTSFGNGDVVFQLNSSGLSQCPGFWLRATDPGFKTAVAALLTANASQAAVTVFADTSQIWTGSVTQFCLVYMISQ